MRNISRSLKNPGKYILGITTDGKMYASSKVARDRDRLREQVLEGLGWKLYHLWSTDWYRNRDLGRKKLLDFIEKSIKQTRKEQKIAREKEEKRRLEAEKRAEELRKQREKELEEQRQKEAEAKAAMLGDDVEVIPPDGELDFDDDIIFVSKDEIDDFDDGVEFTKESPSEFVQAKEETKEVVADESPSEFVTINEEKEDNSEDLSDFISVSEDSSAFDDFIFKDDDEFEVNIEDNSQEKDSISDDIEVVESSGLDDDLKEDIPADSDFEEDVSIDSDNVEVVDESSEINNDLKDDVSGVEVVDESSEINDDLNDDVSGVEEDTDKSKYFDDEDTSLDNDDILDVDINENDSDEVNVEEFLEELSDGEDDDLDNISDKHSDDGEEDEDTFTSDKDYSEDVQYKDEEREEELQEEIDDDSDSSKVNFGSSISKASGGGILSSIKNKFSLFNDDESEEDVTDSIKDKIEEDDFIYVDHSNDEIPEENMGDFDNQVTDEFDSGSFEEDIEPEPIEEVSEPETSDIDDSA